MIKVTCAIIIKDNKILVTQRGKDSSHPFKWEFPGGKLKNFETLEECIIREIKEELNIEIEIFQDLIPLIYDYGNIEIELIPFLCKIIKGDILLTEHICYKWLGFEDLYSVDFSEADKKLIRLPETQNRLEKYARK